MKIFWPIVPVLLALLVLLLRPSDDAGRALPPIDTLSPEITSADERLLIVIIDSLRLSTLQAHMPRLSSLANNGDAHLAAVQTCSANFTLPCIQTLLEGRQSPFAAGLHNFTGRSGGAVNFPATLAAANAPPDLISDHTLGSLYKAHAHSDFDVQSLPDDALSRDLAAISRARQHLADGSRAVILHVVGTDKVAHYQKPGHPDYIAQFSAVDAALSDLLSDPSLLRYDRDHVVITGDHGHNQDGHHTRDSIALLWGLSYHQLWNDITLPPAPPPSDPPSSGPQPAASLEQTDLLFFLSHPFALPLPTSYEGRYFVGTQPPTPNSRRARQDDAQRRALLAAQITLDDIPKAFSSLRAAERARRSDSIWQNAPLLCLYALFCILALSSLFGSPPAPSLRPFDARFHRDALSLVLISVAVAALSSLGPATSWSLLLILPASAWLIHSRRATRHALWVCFVIAMSAFCGRYATEWASYFHSTGAFKYQIVLFYLMMAAGGALLGWLAWGKGLRGWPEGGLMFGFMALPSGVYYYQFGSAMCWGFLIGGALSSLSRGRHALRWETLTPKTLGALLGLLSLSPLLIAQTAGGWEWHHKAVAWLQALGSTPTWLIGASLCAFLVWQAAHTPRSRIVLGSIITLGALYSAAIGKMPSAPLVASHIAVAVVISWLRLPHPLSSPWTPTQTNARLAWLVFGLGLASQWLALRGFFIQNIDFTFGLEAFGWLQRERDIFIATTLATIPKYGLPLFVMLLAVRIAIGAAQTRSLFAALFLFGSLKMLTLLVQIISGMQSDGEQRYELAISELIFIFNYLMIISVAYLPAQFLGKVADKGGASDLEGGDAAALKP
jgi:hypothetical protein